MTKSELTAGITESLQSPRRADQPPRSVRKPGFPFLAAESDEMLHLDLLRFYAAYGIVFLHMRSFLELPTSYRVWLEARVESLALFVDLFFVISGFVIAFVYGNRMRSLRDYGWFMRRRVARLVPLHWATLGIYALLGIYILSQDIHVNNAGVWDFDCFWSNFALLHAAGFCDQLSFNTVSWSISAEMFMYLLFPCFLWLLHRSKPLYCALLVAVLTALLMAPLVASELPPWYRWTYEAGVVRALPSFLFGMLLYELRSNLVGVAYPRTLCWGALLLFLVGAAGGWPAPVLLALLYVVSVMGVAADIQRRGGRSLRLIAPWGKLTYSIYMLHGLVMLVLLNVALDRVLRFHGSARNFFVFFSVIAVGPVSYLSYSWFETPIRRSLSGRRASRSDDARDLETGIFPRRWLRWGQ